MSQVDPTRVFGGKASSVSRDLAEENSPVKNLVQDFSPFAIGLIAFNALVFATLYARKYRPELVERHLAWVLRADLALAERKVPPGAR
jgi:hypothetical protein